MKDLIIGLLLFFLTSIVISIAVVGDLEKREEIDNTEITADQYYVAKNIYGSYNDKTVVFYKEIIKDGVINTREYRQLTDLYNKEKLPTERQKAME